jgi:lysine-N-methylase
MQGFTCLAADCEDHCCALWTILVDQSHYDQIRDALSREAHGEHEVSHCLKLKPEAERAKGPYASMRLRFNGNCPMLDDDRLCLLHKRYGGELLPDTCAIYPRKLNRVGDCLELSGSISCPELARRALLCEGALELVPFDRQALGREVLAQQFGEHSGDHDVRHLDSVRRAMTEHADRTELRLETRLLCMAALAIETEALFQPEATRFHQGRLEQAIEQLRQPQSRAFLEQRIADGGEPTPAAMHVVLSVLAVHLRAFARSPLRPRLEAALASLSGSRLPEGVDLEQQCLDLSATPEPLLDAYCQRRQSLPGSLAARVELVLRNYLKLFWLREWHVTAPNLKAHVQGLMVRLALLRFLLIGQPEMVTAAAGGELAVLDRLVVDVFHLFARAVEHDQRFLGALSRTLERDLLQPSDWIGLICL